MDQLITRTRLLLVAAAFLASLVVPVALAASDGDSGSPQARSVKGKIKKLSNRVKKLENQLAAVQGEQDGPRPPSGAAGGDLTGNYPNPAIAAGAVTTAKLADGAVNSAKVANGSLTGPDIDQSTLFNDNSLTTGDIDESTLFNDNSLTTGDIDESTLFNDNSLTGADIADTSSIGTAEIDESSLSQVPNASTASGLNSALSPNVPYGADTFNFDAGTTASNTVVASFDGLVLQADCDAGPDVQLFASPGATNSYLNTATITTGAVADSVVDTSFDAMTGDLLPVGDGSGTIVYRNGDDVTEAPSNNVTSIVFAYEEGPLDGTAGACQLMATVFGGGIG